MQSNDGDYNFDDRKKKFENRKKADGEKFCPFSLSNPKGPVICNPACKLYRQGKSFYVCPFQELVAISFKLGK